MAGFEAEGIPRPDSRDREQLEEEIGRLSVSYTPQWRFNREQPDMGTALARLFAVMMEESIGQYNKLLEINRREFMECVGAQKLAEGLAEGYMTFGLVKPDMPECLVPSGTGVSAVTPSGSVGFETAEEVWVSAAKVDFVVVQGNGEDGEQPGLYLCFDRDLSGNVISLLVLLSRSETTVGGQARWEYGGQVGWEYGSQVGWLPLEAEDGTDGLSHSGILRFAGPPDIVSMEMPGSSDIVSMEMPGPSDIASKQMPGTSDIASKQMPGSSDIASMQMPGPSDIASMELPGPSDIASKQMPGPSDIASRQITSRRGYWLRAVPGPDARQRTFTGVEAVCMNGVKVRAVRPGTPGNLAPGGKHRLARTVGFVSVVRNPDYFYGGSGEESEEAFMARSGAGLRHEGRAVTPLDFESLVQAACRDAYRVKCYPGYEETGKKRYGAVTVVILQREFQEGRRYFYKVRERAEDCLRDRVSRELMEGNLLSITAPRLIRIDVQATICVREIRRVMEIRKQAREMLEGFLNPISGGNDGAGWDLGQLPEYRQLKNCLQNVPGVLYVKQLSCLCFEERNGHWREVEQRQASRFPWVLPMAGECRVEVLASRE